jgi:hypothetical protein
VVTACGQVEDKDICHLWALPIKTVGLFNPFAPSRHCSDDSVHDIIVSGRDCALLWCLICGIRTIHFSGDFFS